MKKKDLNAKQFLSISCPTCGVAAGMRCERYSGVLRKEPHVARKSVAVEMVENAAPVNVFDLR
jgi:hypothetical protein